MITVSFSLDDVKTLMDNEPMSLLAKKIVASLIAQCETSLPEKVCQVFNTSGYIPAIKFHRTETGNGIAESKMVVEKILRDAGLR